VRANRYNKDMSIEELIDYFRGEPTCQLPGGIPAYDALDPRVQMADQLEAWAAVNMPGWTRITEDESTWPKDGDVAMFFSDVAPRTVGSNYIPIKDRSVFGCRKWLGACWRPLTAYDTPTEDG